MVVVSGEQLQKSLGQYGGLCLQFCSHHASVAVEPSTALHTLVSWGVVHIMAVVVSTIPIVVVLVLGAVAHIVLVEPAMDVMAILLEEARLVLIGAVETMDPDVLIPVAFIGTCHVVVMFVLGAVAHMVLVEARLVLIEVGKDVGTAVLVYVSFLGTSQ